MGSSNRPIRVPSDQCVVTRNLYSAGDYPGYLWSSFTFTTYLYHSLAFTTSCLYYILPLPHLTFNTIMRSSTTNSFTRAILRRARYVCRDRRGSCQVGRDDSAYLTAR